MHLLLHRDHRQGFVLHLDLQWRTSVLYLYETTDSYSKRVRIGFREDAQFETYFNTVVSFRFSVIFHLIPGHSLRTYKLHERDDDLTQSMRHSGA